MNKHKLLASAALAALASTSVPARAHVTLENPAALLDVLPAGDAGGHRH